MRWLPSWKRTCRLWVSKMTYEQALDYIHSRIHLGTRKGLFRMEALMERL